MDTSDAPVGESAGQSAPMLEPQQETPSRAAKPVGQPKPADGGLGQTLWATGRRKEAIARVRLMPGSGRILVNKRPYDEYFPREAWRVAVRQALFVTHQLGKHDVLASVEGGGTSGQAGAVRLGIARALVRLDETHRSTLRAAGLLTRDPRMKERKKYGQKGARKRFQWTKR